MDRREFLKKAYQIGGLAALYSLGAGAIEEARAWGVLPATIFDPALELEVSPWSAGANTFIIYGDGATNANEEGEGGGLAGADLVWTQNGGIAGSGTYRTLDGTDDYFSVTTGFRDFFAGATSYGLLFKLEDWSPDANYEAIIRWSAELFFRVTTLAGTPYPLNAHVNGNEIGTTTNGIPTSGTLFCYLGCDGSDTMVGFTQTGSGTNNIPIQKSDFAVNDRALRGAATTMTNPQTTADPDIFRDSDSNNREVGAKFHWAVLCNNDSLIGAL